MSSMRRVFGFIASRGVFFFFRGYVILLCGQFVRIPCWYLGETSERKQEQNIVTVMLASDQRAFLSEITDSLIVD